MCRWSSSTALIGARRPRNSARRCCAVKRSSSGSRPTRAAKNASSASAPNSSSPVPKRRTSVISRRLRATPRPPRASWSLTLTCVGSDSGSHRTPPVMRRCWARWTSSSKLHTRYLPRRPRRSTRLPSSAAASSPGASGRDQRSSKISIRSSLLPSTSGASWRLIVSTSGSSGIGVSLRAPHGTPDTYPTNAGPWSACAPSAGAGSRVPGPPRALARERALK